jgi:hypothetical protein
VHGQDVRVGRLCRGLCARADDVLGQRRRDVRRVGSVGGASGLHQPDLRQWSLPGRVRARPDELQRRATADMRSERAMEKQRTRLYEKLPGRGMLRDRRVRQRGALLLGLLQFRGYLRVELRRGGRVLHRHQLLLRPDLHAGVPADCPHLQIAARTVQGTTVNRLLCRQRYVPNPRRSSVQHASDPELLGQDHQRGVGERRIPVRTAVQKCRRSPATPLV